MTCVLRISGSGLNVDELLAESSLVRESLYRKGEPKLASRPQGPRVQSSGASFLVSPADFNDLNTQKNDALTFLRENQKTIKRIMNWPGLASGCLDFGIYWRDAAAQYDSFPPDLLKIMGELGLELEISHYPCSQPEEPPNRGMERREAAPPKQES